MGTEYMYNAGFSPGILSIRRKTSKSRKFGILKFERSADKCEPSLVNKKSCKIPTIQLRSVMKKHTW